MGGVGVGVWGDRIRHMGVDHARLDHHSLIGDVDLEDPIHAGKADYDAALGRQSATAEPRSRAARDEGNLMQRTHADDRLNLPGASGKDDGTGYGAEVRQAIALVS